jgi:hypothetical protein
MALVSTISLAEAIARGHEFWELALSDWGDDAALAASAASRFPVPQGALAIPGLTGIAISPSSLVDQANILYRLKSPVYYDGTVLGAREFTLKTHTDVLEVSAKRPWLGVLPGPIEEITAFPLFTAFVTGAVGMGVWASTHYISAEYLPIGTSTPAPFGPVLGASVWLDPVLRLLFYLRNPPPSVAPARAPFSWRASVLTTNGTELLMQVVPISGRRRVRVTFRHAGAGLTAEVRLTGVISSSAVAPEIQLAPGVLPSPSGVTTVAANAPATFYLDDPQVTYLLLYAKGAVGAPTLSWDIYADD